MSDDAGIQRPSGRLALFLEQLQAELDERAIALSERAEQFEAERLAWRQQQAMQREELRRALFDAQQQQETLEKLQHELAAERERLAGEEQRIQEQVERQLQADRQELWETL